MLLSSRFPPGGKGSQISVKAFFADPHFPGFAFIFAQSPRKLGGDEGTTPDAPMGRLNFEYVALVGFYPTVRVAVVHNVIERLFCFAATAPQIVPLLIGWGAG